MTLFSSILGENVSIEWRNDGDWPWYKVINYDFIKNGEYWLFLSGRDSPDGAKFVGSQFWVRLSDISIIEFGDADPFWNRGSKKDDIF